MIFRKALAWLAAAAAIAAAVVVGVVAAAIALYAIAREAFTPAGAAAIVALAAAIPPLIIALLMVLKARQKPEPEDQSLIARLFEVAKQRPIMATGAMAAAAVMAIRNPRILTMVLTTLMASKPPKPK